MTNLILEFKQFISTSPLTSSCLFVPLPMLSRYAVGFPWRHLVPWLQFCLYLTYINKSLVFMEAGLAVDPPTAYFIWWGVRVTWMEIWHISLSGGVFTSEKIYLPVLEAISDTCRSWRINNIFYLPFFLQMTLKMLLNDHSAGGFSSSWFTKWKEDNKQTLWSTARPHRHACEVVSDKASKLSTQTQSSKYCR